MAFVWPHQWAQLGKRSQLGPVDLTACDTSTRPGSRRGIRRFARRWVEPIWSYGSHRDVYAIHRFSERCAPADMADGSYGEALPGNAIKIVDPATGAVVPRGHPGEIAVKGPTLMLGYIGIPLGETLDDEGFFHSGDGGYIEQQGRLHLEGRLTDIIKTGGANVSPVEVDLILNTCPGVKVRQTVGVPHETLGELVVACIVTHDGAVLDEASVRDS